MTYYRNMERLLYYQHIKYELCQRAFARNVRPPVQYFGSAPTFLHLDLHFLTANECYIKHRVFY